MKVRKIRTIDAFTGRMIIIVSIVVLICICGLGISQAWVHRQIKNDIISQNMAMLDMTKTVVDSYMDQTQKLAQMLLLNKNITRFIYQGRILEGSSEIQTIIDAQSQLPATKSVNPMLSEIFAYSRTNGYLVSSNNAFFDVDSMYPLFAFEGMNSRQWQSKYLWSEQNDIFFPSVMATVEGRKRKVIPYIRTFPLTNPSENAGKLLMLLDEDFFLGLLAQLDIGDGGRYCIAGSDGTILLSNGAIGWDPTALPDGQHDIVGKDGERYLVSVSRSTTPELTFLSAVPYKELSRRVNPVWGIFSFSVTLALFCCFAIIVISTYKSQKDWMRLKLLIGREPAEAGKASYEEVADLIKSITEQQSESELHEGKIPFMTETFFRRLIHGKKINPSDSLASQTKESLSFPIAPGMVITMAKIFWHYSEDMSNLEEIDFSRIAAMKEARRSFGKRHYLYMDLSFNLWLLIWDENRKKLQKDLETFWNIFRKISPLDASIAISSPNHVIETMGGAPSECNLVEQTIRNENIRIACLRYEDLTKRTDFAVFTKEEEKTLLIDCMKRDAAGTKKLLQDIFQANFVTRKLPPDQLRFLFGALYDTAVSYCQKDKNATLPPQFLLFKDVMDFFLSYAGEAPQTKDERDAQLVTNIQAYIQNNYQDQNLTLSKMAYDLKVRESFLYHFINTRMLTSFSQYLEEFRLTRAKDLLTTERDTPISSISSRCGYGNPQTFRRAFKKLFGSLPSDYRGGHAH